jgi:Na+-driven multidrug efflux pump
VAVQTALLGHWAPTSAVGAFAAVGTCVGFACRAFNFLLDGVSSKVGRSVGQRAWGALASHVALSMRWSLLLGAAAVPLLLAAQRPLLSWLLALSGEVQSAAGGYWLIRTFLIPVQLLNMAASGILQVGGGRRWFGMHCWATPSNTQQQ